MPNIDPNIYKYFLKLVQQKYGATLDQRKAEEMALQLYDKFTKYLLNEFKQRVQLNKAQLQQIKDVSEKRTNTNDILALLNELSHNNLAQDLDSVLLSILESFTTEVFNN